MSHNFVTLAEFCPTETGVWDNRPEILDRDIKCPSSLLQGGLVQGLILSGACPNECRIFRPVNRVQAAAAQGARWSEYVSSSCIELYRVTFLSAYQMRLHTNNDKEPS